MIYIAAPFFNPKQLVIVEMLERVLAQFVDQDVYSPRKAGVLNPRKSTPEERTRIFKSNIEAIARSELVIAVTTFALPDDMSLRLCNSADLEDSVKIALPDTGTVWEVGCARGLKIPVVGYHELTANEEPYLNVMLTEAFEGFVHNEQQLTDFLIHHYYVSAQFQEARILNLLKPWKGKVR